MYIRSASCISPQPSFGAAELPAVATPVAANMAKSIEPDYKTHLNIPAARRMSRLIKVGVCAALSCLKDSGVTVPDAIIAGTGLGCLEDSEKFLASLITNQEGTLSPTAFIFSTHNTVAGQIALLLQCNNYNFTHTHRGLSFENSLMDARLFLNDNPQAQVLAGASDEVTETSFRILQRLGAVKKETGENGNHATGSIGTVAGEGSAFFLINNTADENSLAKISGLASFSNPESDGDIQMRIQKFVSEQKISDEDLVLYGFNGDEKGDDIYRNVRKNFFGNNPAGHFKHLCGEYHTSTAFAVWVAALILKNQETPSYILMNDEQPVKAVKRILIFNHYKGREFSFILLEKC